MMVLEKGADRISGYAMCVVLGYILSGVINHTAAIPGLWWEHAKLQTEEKVVIPKLESVAGCQLVRARVATNLAKSSESGADIDLHAIPNCPLLPASKPKVNPHK